MSHPDRATASPAPADPKRTTALVLGWIAVVPLALIHLLFLLIILTSEGASQMAAVLPMIAYVLTGWIWAILAFIALMVARDARRPVSPSVVALIGLALAFLGLLYLIPR
ncbi:hypothetical protein [Microbacterium sp. P04]|uniref:hypothetical protein n=1 Tax=Microbacterium sp. P04 TaxID=3366947 RepID=UPI0037475CEF